MRVVLFLTLSEQINARDKANQHPLSGDFLYIEGLAIKLAVVTVIVPQRQAQPGL